MTTQLAAGRRLSGGGSDSNPPSLPQAAREGAMEAWLEILSQRHPELLWVAKEGAGPRNG
jgi:hypothetical protein